MIKKKNSTITEIALTPMWHKVYRDFSTTEMNVRTEINSLPSFSFIRTHLADSHYYVIRFTLVRLCDCKKQRLTQSEIKGLYCKEIWDYKGTRNFMRVLGEI